MKSKFNRMAAKKRGQSPHKWVAEYLSDRHKREQKPKEREWRDIDETSVLAEAPAARGWVVLMVEPRLEAKAASALREAGYVAWYPQTVETVVNTARRTRRKVNRPLFPRYVFAASFGRIGMGDCDHVSAIVGPVSQALVANLSDRQAQGEFEAKAPAPVQFGKGATVRITDGPFASFDGIVHKSARDRVEVLVGIFGRPTLVRLEPQQVEAA